MVDAPVVGGSLLVVCGWGEALDGRVEPVAALGLEHPAGILGWECAYFVQVLELIGG